MTYQDLIPFADLCQGITIVFALVGYIPQWYEFIRNRSVENVSLQTWYLWLLSCLLSWFYAFVHYVEATGGGVLLLTASLGLAFHFITISLILTYRANACGKSHALSGDRVSPITPSSAEVL